MFSQAFDLATMQHCVDQWNAQWPESDCSTQRNVICLAWWLLVPLIINERAPLLTFKVLFTLRSAVMLYLVKQTWWSLFGLFAQNIKHDVMIGWSSEPDSTGTKVNEHKTVFILYPTIHGKDNNWAQIDSTENSDGWTHNTQNRLKNTQTQMK